MIQHSTIDLFVRLDPDRPDDADRLLRVDHNYNGTIARVAIFVRPSWQADRGDHEIYLTPQRFADLCSAIDCFRETRTTNLYDALDLGSGPPHE